MTKSKGFRKKTRYLFRKKPRTRGKLGLDRLIRNYKPGDKVVIKIDSSVHKGMPHRRYHGRIAIITGKKGRSYALDVTQGDSVKQIFVRPEHIINHQEE